MTIVQLQKTYMYPYFPYRRFFFLKCSPHPPQEILGFASYFPFKSLAAKNSLTLGILNDLPKVGMDFFRNCIFLHKTDR